jgi:hypothetical protein
MNITSIILISRDHSFIKGIYVLLGNIYVTILGVVFATIWTNRQNWNQSSVETDGSGPSFGVDRPAISTIRFDAAPYMSNMVSNKTGIHNDMEAIGEDSSVSLSISNQQKVKEQRALVAA